MKTRSMERTQFLADVLTTAIEHSGYGFPQTITYEWSDDDPASTHAEIFDRYEAEDEPFVAGKTQTWTITIDTIAHGFGVARAAKKAAGGRLADWAEDVLLADRTNGEDGDIDVVGALWILECALFGKQIYS